MNELPTPEEMRLIGKTHGEVMDIVNNCGLDAFAVIAVLTKCLVQYAVLVEDRDEFYMRMAMTYDFEKSQQPESKEIH